VAGEWGLNIVMYMDITLSSNSWYSALSPFHAVAGSAALAAIPICHESGSTYFSSVYGCKIFTKCI
jgi:hypothetical protein